MCQDRRLLATNNWNPIGESVLSVVLKLSKANHMNWVEFRREIGAYELRSFTSPLRQHADNQNNYNIKNIIQMTGWSKEIIDTSFSYFYRHLWDNDSIFFNENTFLISKNIRICPECIKYGVHLVFHQMIEFKLCPIHGCELRHTYPCYGETTCAYSLDSNIFDQHTCSSGPGMLFEIHPGTNNALISCRERLVEQYSTWMNELYEEYQKQEKFVWLDNTINDLNLSIVDKLMPGPSWIRECLVGVDTLNHSIHTWRVNREMDDLTTRLYPDKITLHGSVLRQRKKMYETFSIAVDNILKYIDIAIANIDMKFNTPNFINVINEVNSNVSCQETGYRITAWAKAFYLLRKDFTYDVSDVMYARYVGNQAEYTLKYGLLVQCENLLNALSRRQNFNSPIWCNQNFINWFSKEWITQTVFNYYFLLVGVVIKKFGRAPTSMLGNFYEIRTLGRLPIWFIEQHECIPRVHRFSTISNFDQFLDLRCSGFEFDTIESYQSFAQVKPLIELLGISPLQQELWQSLWEKTTPRQSL